MICQCALRDGWKTHTGSPAFARALRFGESSGILRLALFDSSGREKNALRNLRYDCAGLLRPQGTPGARPLLWRHAGLPGGRGPARVVPKLRCGETGEAALG